MARLIYEITGDISGLESAINQASNLIRDAGAQTSQIKITIPDISPQIKAGVGALDQLDQKLTVIQGNATLFGDSIKLQSQSITAYQAAINTLLSNGFDPMDGDVQRLKEHVDQLTASLKNVKSVQPPGSFINDTSPLPSQENVFNPNLTGSVAQQSQLITALNEQLATGVITAEEYSQALLNANTAVGQLAQSAGLAAEGFENELGVIAGLKQALAELNSIRLNTLNEQDLPRLNAEIQETEIEIQRLSNIGKQGFDQFGNSIRGVSVQSINGQLTSLSNNLFGARQISRDLVRTFDSTSVGTFARSIGLLAVDFLFFAQNAQFAAGATSLATGAIAVEGEVATGSALSTGALGAAFASLLTPTSLIVLGIAAAGAAFIAFDKSQKNSTQSATEHLKVLREQKQALADYITTLNPSQEVEAHAAENYAVSTIKLNELVFAVKNNTGALFDGQTALEDLQRLYPNYFADLDEAATKTDAFTQATNGARDSLKALGEFTAANKLAEQSIETAQSSQVAADSLIPSLVRARQELQKTLQAAQNAADAQKLIASQAGTGVAANLPVFEAESKVKDILAQIQQYNTTIAEANVKTQAFFDIANKNAPLAGLVTKFKGAQDVVDQFETLKQKLDEITQKSSTLAGNNGITGYASDVAAIVKQFTDLNNAISSFTIQVNKAFDRGALTSKERNNLLAPLPALQANLPGNEDTAINDARIKNAQATADAIQKINDQFGIKEQAGFNEELSRVKKLYDGILEEARKAALTQEQIEQNKQNAIANANGDPKVLADIQRNYEAQIQQAKDAQAKVAAAQADLLPAIQAIDEKYIQQEQQTYGKIIDIANQAFEALDTGEAARTDKINLEWQKRITSANAYFDKLRDLAKASNLSQSATDNINTIQAQVNVLLKAANTQQISVEISKPFADAMQSAVNGFVTNFYTSLTTLGTQRQAIDDKYLSQLTAATDDSARQQIENLRKIEQQATTSFGAVFSSLVSKFSSSFNESILSSLTKQFTENLGKTLLAPTAKQLTISPQEQAAQNVSTLLKNAGNDLATDIKQAGVDFANSVKGASVNPLSSTGVDAKGNLVPLNNFNVPPGTEGELGSTFNEQVSDSGIAFGSVVQGAAQEGATQITKGAQNASASITESGSKLSLSVARAASALSIAGGIVSGATSPTSSVGQGVGGALSGAAEGALIGSAIPVVGTIAGAVVGGAIGLISGLFSASKAKKQEELQQKQLEAQQETNELIARQNALAYTSSIVGRMTTQGIITGADINSFGQLTARISGKDVEFVLGRTANGR